MTVSDERFPSSGLFDAINDALGDNQDEVRDAIKKGNGIFAFVLKNKAGETASWHVDLKETGRVGKGTSDKPNVTLMLSDEHFGQLVLGEATPQRLFMTGKLKLKGDIMKALRLEPVLKTVQTKAKL